MRLRRKGQKLVQVLRNGEEEEEKEEEHEEGEAGEG
jgi:hypothetical protein